MIKNNKFIVTFLIVFIIKFPQTFCVKTNQPFIPQAHQSINQYKNPLLFGGFLAAAVVAGIYLSKQKTTNPLKQESDSDKGISKQELNLEQNNPSNKEDAIKPISSSELNTLIENVSNSFYKSIPRSAYLPDKDRDRSDFFLPDLSADFLDNLENKIEQLKIFQGDDQSEAKIVPGYKFLQLGLLLENPLSKKPIRINDSYNLINQNEFERLSLVTEFISGFKPGSLKKIRELITKKYTEKKEKIAAYKKALTILNLGDYSKTGFFMIPFNSLFIEIFFAEQIKNRNFSPEELDPNNSNSLLQIVLLNNQHPKHQESWKKIIDTVYNWDGN